LSVFERVRLYCFSPGPFARGRDPVEMVKAQIRGGADVVQLREKAMTKRERLELGLGLRALTRETGVLFIVNDDVDLALILDADGVHRGQEDIPLDHARTLMKERIIGVSTHSWDQIQKALSGGADYIGVGPVFETRTKEDPEPRVGLELLSRLGGQCPVPYVAIGGIKGSNIRSVVAAGCHRAAVISDILLAPDIEAHCRTLRSILA